jgi:prevent-host-death family protein
MKKRTQLEAAGTDRRLQGTGPGTISVTATEAQNEFGRILDTVAQDRMVVITRHNTPRAVVMSVDRFNELSGVDTTVLDTLTEEFDALFDRMQTPEADAAMDRAFNASPEELGRAAAAAARRRAR